MSDIDEYDAYNNSLDEHYAHLEASVPPRDVPPESLASSQAAGEPTTFDTESSEDEFAAYDFPELTEEDFANIDAATQTALEPSYISLPRYAPTNASTKDQYEVSKPTARSDVQPGNLFGGPAIEIQIERYANTSTFKARGSNRMFSTSNDSNGLNAYHPPRSPYQEFRKRKNALSVTDLTGPAWCEVQFDYGLRQGRSKKLKDRPAVFVTAEGNTITVDNDVAAVNDQITTKGTTVHKALEREIHPDELIVDVETPQDRWALHLVDMINSILSLIEQGCCREMPVFGFLYGELIVGVIDSVERRTISSADVNSLSTNGELKQKREPHNAVQTTPSNPKAKEPPAQTQITSFFSPSSSKVQFLSDLTDEGVDPIMDRSRPLYQLYLSDTKTRNRPTMPAEEDTLSARLQLMVYHKLLCGLMVHRLSPHALNFTALWAREKLSSTAPLSEKFIRQAELDKLGGPDTIWTLGQLVRIFRTSVEALNVQGVNPELTVEYRTQNNKSYFSKYKSTQGRSAKGKERAFDEDVPMSSQADRAEEAEVEDALLASSQDMDISSQPSIIHTVWPSRSAHVDPGGSLTASEHWGSAPGAADADDVASDRQLQWAIEQSLRTVNNASTTDALPSADEVAEQTSTADEDVVEENDEAETSAHKKWSVIGTKTFWYDEEFISGYLTSILEYWHGDRAPRGVEIALTRRCSWCEYREGCEWRAQKARELDSIKTSEESSTMDP